MLVELKNGETLNGHLVTCDTWMNLTLKEVVQTSAVSLSCQEKTQSYIQAVGMNVDSASTESGGGSDLQYW